MTFLGMKGTHYPPPSQEVLSVTHYPMKKVKVKVCSIFKPKVNFPPICYNAFAGLHTEFGPPLSN